MGAAKASIADTVPGAAMYDGLPPELAAALTRKATAEAVIAESQAESEKLGLKNLRASNDQNRVLILSGAIMESDDIINVLQRWGRRDPGKPITIYLNTPGGSVFDGNALVACIKSLRKSGHKITIYGAGTVMSFGAVLLQAADERVLDSDTVFMLHSLNAPQISGGLEQIMDTTKMLEAVQERMIEALAERATITKAKIKQLTKRKDLYLSAQDALTYGFCDRVE